MLHALLVVAFNFVAVVRERPKLLRQSRLMLVIIRAANGCENTNMARMLDFGKPSSPLKTSTPASSLLPTCPGGLGRMLNMV